MLHHNAETATMALSSSAACYALRRIKKLAVTQSCQIKRRTAKLVPDSWTRRLAALVLSTEMMHTRRYCDGQSAKVRLVSPPGQQTSLAGLKC